MNRNKLVDVLVRDEGGMWFESSRMWEKEREVYYEVDCGLVPLMRSEVPFDYPSGLVFLFSRDQGVAVATSLAAAWLPERCVAHVLSRAALFGTRALEDGMCYLAATGGVEVGGPFPTAAELRASGAVSLRSGVAFERVEEDRYHCVDTGGLSLDSVPDQAVIGSFGTAVGYAAAGVTAVTTAVDVLEWAWQRAAVSTAATVDLCAKYDPEPAGELTIPALDLKWFASKALEDGLVLNVGLVDTRGFASGGFAEVLVPSTVRKLYWNLDEKGTRACCAARGRAVVEIPSGLGGLYVYSVTVGRVFDVVAHPVRSVGYADFDCSCGRCVVSAEADSCYRILMPPERVCSCRAHSWAVLSRFGSAELFPGGRVRKVSESSWHLGHDGHLTVEEVFGAIGAARSTGSVQVLVRGCVIGLHDMVGAVSAMAVSLQAGLSALSSVALERMDTYGARLAGSPPSVLSSQDKVELKVLQTVGDNLLSLALSLEALGAGATAQAYQEARSVRTCNPHLCALFVGSVHSEAFVGGVASLPPKTGGGAFEAIVAVVYRAGGMAAVNELLSSVGFVGG